MSSRVPADDYIHQIASQLARQAGARPRELAATAEREVSKPKREPRTKRDRATLIRLRRAHGDLRSSEMEELLLRLESRPRRRPGAKARWDDFLVKEVFYSVEAIRQRGLTLTQARREFLKFALRPLPLPPGLPRPKRRLTLETVEKRHRQGRRRFGEKLNANREEELHNFVALRPPLEKLLSRL
jgi:hypothetical protein